MKLGKQDFKNNQYNLFLSFVYTCILCLVYGTWAQKRLGIWWVTLLIVIGIVCGGLITGILWTMSESKKNSNHEIE